MNTLQEKYVQEIRPALQERYGYSSPMQVPSLIKVTLNMGVGEALGDRKVLDNAVGDLSRISGQQPLITKARKSEAGFKIREGYPIGCKVTLRRQRMYEFVERLIGIAIPRMRDFRGLNPNAFDGRGNFSMGIPEQIVFPEIDYAQIDKIRGLDITIVIKSIKKEDSFELLKKLNFPFKNSKDN